MLGMNGSGGAEQPRAPGEGALFLGFGLMIEDRLPVALDDETWRDGLRRFAIDAFGVDVPIAGTLAAWRARIGASLRYSSNLPAAPPFGRA